MQLNYMRTKRVAAGAAGVSVLVFGAMVATAFAAGPGYNYTARVFVGSLSQWCAAEGITNATTCGSYGFGSANDQLVMKWNAQWDACNANGYDNPQYCAGAWVDNEYNGNVPGGDGYVWHYKIIWVGSQASASPYWQPGGYSVWGNYEVVMDQGITPGSRHASYALATPNGYGVGNN